jgi:cob(I)alamin adenosyltransferase
MARSNMSEITAEEHRRKMQRRQEVQAKRLAERQLEKGLIIVNTG